MASSIHSRITTISLQNDYNSKLTEATYDSIKAFQINTVNNHYSSISDSKIRDIEAAASSFFNALGTSMGLSSEDLQNHVPALVFNLYDGYYIYTKYDNSYPKSNGKPVLDSKSAQTNYGLKPYIYYSCRYKVGSNIYVVNYTLDNAITVFYTSGGASHTKSGYLINPGSVTSSVTTGDIRNWSVTYNGVKISPEVLTEHLLFADGTEGNYEYLVYNGQKIYRNSYESYFWYQNYGKTNIQKANSIYNYLRARDYDGHLHSTSAVEYYANAKTFSAEIETLLGGITQANAIDAQENKIEDFSVNTGENKIFDFNNSTNDPLLDSSIFNQNRISVIRKSIETNLKAAIANYSSYSSNGYTYQIPVLGDADWEKISNNISVTSFLQGIPIGYKFYNNYCVISNDNNEENISKDKIYIIATNNSKQREYHVPGCEYLLNSANDYTIEPEPAAAAYPNINFAAAYSNISFMRQTVRISEGNYKYFYPQSRGKSPSQTITSCYYCIVNAANVYPIDQIISGKVARIDRNITSTEIGRLSDIRKSYFHALARERYDLYLTNMNEFN